MEIARAPQGLESARNLLFSGDCLEFLVKLVDAFDAKIDEVRENKKNAANLATSIRQCQYMNKPVRDTVCALQLKGIKKHTLSLLLVCLRCCVRGCYGVAKWRAANGPNL